MEFPPPLHALLTVAADRRTDPFGGTPRALRRPRLLVLSPHEPRRRTDEPSAIDVEVTSTSCPASDAPIIFECDDAWSMQLEPDGYRVSFRRVDTREIHTVLRSDRETIKVNSPHRPRPGWQLPARGHHEPRALPSRSSHVHEPPRASRRSDLPRGGGRRRRKGSRLSRACREPARARCRGSSCRPAGVTRC